jgi:hypothetical protein
MNDYEKIQEAFGKAIAQQQGHVKNSNEELMDEMKQLKQEHQPSIVELLREMRDDIRLMRQAMEPKKQYETKVDKPAIRYKGQFENTSAMEVPETKNGQ